MVRCYLAAISGSQRGYMIAEVDLDLSQVKITEALSQKVPLGGFALNHCKTKANEWQL